MPCGRGAVRRTATARCWGLRVFAGDAARAVVQVGARCGLCCCAAGAGAVVVSARRRWRQRRAYGSVAGAGRWRRVVAVGFPADAPGLWWLGALAGGGLRRVGRRRKPIYRRGGGVAALMVVLTAARGVRSCSVLARSAYDRGSVAHERRNPHATHTHTHTHTAGVRAVTSPPAAPSRPITPGKRRRSNKCIRVLIYGPVGFGSVL